MQSKGDRFYGSIFIGGFVRQPRGAGMPKRTSGMTFRRKESRSERALSTASYFNPNNSLVLALVSFTIASSSRKNFR